MMALFEADEDIHTYIVKRVTRSEDVTKEQRSLGKGINFGFIYGMRAKHFANYVFENYGVKITPKAFGRDRRLPITNRYRGVAGTSTKDLPATREP